MRHWLWLALPALLLAASWGRPSPLTPIKPRTGENAITLPAYTSLVTLIPSKGGERTVAIVGPANDEVRKQRLGMIALYAYDAHGNCVARDEYAGGLGAAKKRPASDDAAVEWFPPSTATYTLELRNQGADPCLLQLAIR